MALSTEDRLSLHELYGRLAAAQDGGDIAAWAELVAPDGKLVLSSGAEVAGREALREFMQGRVEDLSSLTHLISNIVIDETGEGAKGAANFLCLRNAGDGAMRIRAFGAYADTFVKIDGRWLLAGRRLVSKLPPTLVDAALA